MSSLVRVCALLFSAVCCLRAAVPSGSERILPASARLEELWNEGEFTEGVAAGPDGRIYFSDISRSPDKPGQILRFDPKTRRTTVFSGNSRKSNGLMFDRAGRLIACCGSNGGAMALCIVSASGDVKPWVSKFQGRRLLSPNDLVIAPDGGIYFSDPRYIGSEPEEQGEMGVYRFDPESGKLIRLLGADEIEKPNGVHLSPDAKTLYVAETNNGSRGGPNAPADPQIGRMTLNAFPLLKDGRVDARKKRVLADFGKETGTDGMAIDVEGNIYAAVRSQSRFGIVVFSPAGKELVHIPTPTLPTNCTFGLGSESDTLYVTAGGGLFRIRLKLDGHHPSTAKPGTPIHK
ncbi:MAG: SMP-30/gluconolactonase/LRE family protein [Verrucomicrobiae bacterium]|nr:SMP-30/gluconolactonase/LRE family protein [Verrucomicrobiae bacterium]